MRILLNACNVRQNNDNNNNNINGDNDNEFLVKNIYMQQKYTLRTIVSLLAEDSDLSTSATQIIIGIAILITTIGLVPDKKKLNSETVFHYMRELSSKIGHFYQLLQCTKLAKRLLFVGTNNTVEMLFFILLLHFTQINKVLLIESLQRMIVTTARLHLHSLCLHQKRMLLNLGELINLWTNDDKLLASL